GPTTVSGNAVLNAGGAVTQDGDVQVTGTTAINAAGQTVLLDRLANDFTGRVTVSAADVTLRDASDLSLTGSVTGNLITTTSQALLLGTTTVGGTAVLNAGGAVTQDGDVQVTGTTAINAAGQTVLLDRLANDFTGRVTVSGRDVSLRDANALGLVANVTGRLTTDVGGSIDLGTTVIDDDAGLTASGTVTQSGDLTVKGRLWVNAAGQAVTLDRQDNDFQRRVTISGHDVKLRDKDALDLAATVSGDLTTTSQELNLGPSVVTGKAVLNAGGSLTQDGDVQVTGTTTINAARQNVLLDRAGNDFGGRVTVEGRDVSLQDASLLDLAAMTSGTLSTSSQGLLLGTTTVDGIARISSSGAVTQDGDVVFKATTTIDAPGQSVTLIRSGNDFVLPLTITAGETALGDRNLLEARLDTTNAQLTAKQLKLEGQVRLAGSSLWSSDTTIEVGNLDFVGSGTARLVSNGDGAAMRTNKVEGVSVQDAGGTPLELFIYGAGIFQSAGTRIASSPGVTLSLEAGKASIDLTAGAKVAAKPAGLVGLIEAFAIPVDGQEITHPASGTNRLLGPVKAVTSTDNAQTGGRKSVVAIASDTIRVASSPTPAVNSDTVMLLGRQIEGGGGSIQTWVAATQRRGGGNIATDPAGVNDNGVSILPSIFLIADSPSGAGNFYYGSEFSPIAVSFGGTGAAGNSTLQTIAPYPFRKTGGPAGPVPIYLSTINNGGVGPTGTVQALLARPAAVALSDVRTVVIDGRMVVDTSAYQSIQAANAAILNQLRLEQFESGFSNENVAAQLRKGVITETRVGEAAVDRFLGVAGAESCDGAVAGGTLSCVAAPDAAN
ncbi:hypothetical protein, partial [Accumulibacter sp.]|uniref:hypothetical protein n=1 Tax=Accumulibacter sp. TaxID=2053492 RepID=UPI0025EB6DC4